MKPEIKILPDSYTILRFDPESSIPDFALNSPFYSVTKTGDELSVVCREQELVKGNYRSSTCWKILELEGPLDFSIVGLISDLTGVLKKSGVATFVISSYDTDFILIKKNMLERATEGLKAAGYKVNPKEY